MRSGEVTFFTPNTGACGNKNKASDLIVALGSAYYGSFNKESSYCGDQIYIETADGKKHVTVTVQDACESCAKDHLDLSPAAFEKLGSFVTGVLQIKYKFL
ncbi:hypothetical protein K501DRAFT_227127 [Backusella circina FSU 941]|nr:hypothetical protein K501DRAFT_227127 [Backusella circina FSU 941]